MWGVRTVLVPVQLVNGDNKSDHRTSPRLATVRLQYDARRGLGWYAPAHNSLFHIEKREAGARIRTADLLITNPRRRTSEVPAFCGFFLSD
jgi:hypothetical protein